MNEFQPAFIVLFGSYAKGTARKDSDVDLVKIRDVDTVFAMQIFESGRPLAVMDAYEYTKQKMKAYRMYATLMEQRHPIIESIQSRGSVFGDE